MSYTKHTWQAGESVTAEKLNNSLYCYEFLNNNLLGNNLKLSSDILDNLKFK